MVVPLPLQCSNLRPLLGLAIKLQDIVQFSDAIMASCTEHGYCYYHLPLSAVRSLLLPILTRDYDLVVDARPTQSKTAGWKRSSVDVGPFRGSFSEHLRGAYVVHAIIT